MWLSSLSSGSSALTVTEKIITRSLILHCQTTTFDIQIIYFIEIFFFHLKSLQNFAIYPGNDHPNILLQYSTIDISIKIRFHFRWKSVCTSFHDSDVTACWNEKWIWLVVLDWIAESFCLWIRPEVSIRLTDEARLQLGYLQSLPFLIIIAAMFLRK